MLLRVLSMFCFSDPMAEQGFIRSIRLGGEWQTLARSIAPDLIATDLLRHKQDVSAPLFLCLDFWSTADAFQRALRSPAVQHLLRARREMALSSFEFGAFVSPLPTELFDSARALVN